MKLNEFKKTVVNEIDSRSLFGDYGSAALRTGLGSLAGKNVLSTTDQMAKDDFITKFTSRALSGLQSAINGGLVNPEASGAMQGANIGTKFGKNPATNPATSTPTQTTPQTTPTPQQKQAGTVNIGSPTPAQTRQQKLAAATKVAQDQIAKNGPYGPYSKLPANQASVQAGNIRKQKQAAATKVAQDQIAKNGPSGSYSKLPANQASVQAGNIRKQKQGVATQNAQGQMTKMSPLPADQFNKTATSTRQKQQGQAATAAQGQMTKMSPLPTDQFNKSATNVRRQKQGVATQTAQDQMSTTQKTIKPDNTITMPKRNKKPKSKVAESTRFDKLNYLFENILDEVSLGRALSPTGKVVGQANQQQNKQNTQSISQYITKFFTQFMKGVDSKDDPSVKSQLATLAKELEQTYAKDKGRTTLPKLANLAYSVSYTQADDNTSATNTPQNTQVAPQNTQVAPQNTQAAPQNTQAATQKAKSAYQQIQSLLKGVTPANKQKILTSLQKELASAPAKKTTPTPTGDTDGTYNKKTGAAKLGGKTMVSADDLPPNIQKQIQQK